MINFTGNFSEWDRYGSKRDIQFIEGLDSYEPNAGAEDRVDLKNAMDSVKHAMDFGALNDKLKEQDSLILQHPARYFKNIALSSPENQRVSKLGFFATLLQSDSIYVFDDAVTKYGVGDTFSNELYFDLANGFLKAWIRPGTFVSVLISKLPFAVFFLLPVFALFISLAYIRKKHGYTDHLIFSFHVTALLFILLIISYLIDSIFNVTSNWIFLMVFSVYLFLAMRKFYGQGLFKTSVKYLFLNAIFFILALFAILILLTSNFFTY